MSRWVPRPTDLAVAGVLTAAGQAEAWSGQLATGSLRPALAGLYLVGLLAVAWHRILPLTTLATVLLAVIVAPSALGVPPNDGLVWLIAALGVVASAGYHAARPLVALVIALALVAVAVGSDKGLSVPDIAYAWLLIGGGWVAGRALASRTLRAQLSEQRAVLAEHEAQWRAADAVAEERLRIARELHDVVSHGISVMTLHVGGVRRLLTPDQAGERAVLEAVERTGRESLAEMHRMLGVLRGSAAAAAGGTPGLADLEQLLASARAAGLTATLAVTGVARELPPGVELAAYRIVQEAVTNVLRHARARRLDCSVCYGSTGIELTVTDDGSGTAGDDGVAGGLGLPGMRERAALYGGTVEAGPRPGGGFAVHAALPAPAPAPASSPHRVAGERP